MSKIVGVTVGTPLSPQTIKEKLKKDGFYPVVSVSDIEGGHRITITDTNGSNTADVMDGKDGKDGVNGKDGYTPIKGKDYFDGKDGRDGYTPQKGVDYFDGTSGKDGADGYSPVRGKDYWTEADKTEIKSYVDEAILGGEW